MQLSRRKLIGGIGGIGATTLLGGVGLTALSGSATATAGSTIKNPTPVTSDDGKVTYVAVQTTGRVTWDGFDTPAQYGRIVVRVKYKRDGNIFKRYQIHDTGQFDLTGSWGGNGEETHLSGDHKAGQRGYIASDTDWGIAQRNRKHLYNDGYSLPANPAPVAPLFAVGDGSTQATRVILESEYRLYASDGTELTGTKSYPDRPTATSDFVVEVTNQAASTGFGGADATDDDGDSATVGV